MGTMGGPKNTLAKVRLCLTRANTYVQANVQSKINVRVCSNQNIWRGHVITKFRIWQPPGLIVDDRFLLEHSRTFLLLPECSRSFQKLPEHLKNTDGGSLRGSRERCGRASTRRGTGHCRSSNGRKCRRRRRARRAHGVDDDGSWAGALERGAGDAASRRSARS